MSETYYNRTATSIDAGVGILSSPEALSGIAKIYRHEPGELTMPEAVALEYLVATSLTTLENNHLQYQAGFLSQEHWAKDLKELDCMLTVPLFREVATSWSFRDSFAAVIDDRLQKVPTSAENCWTYYDWNFPMN